MQYFSLQVKPLILEIDQTLTDENLAPPMSHPLSSLILPEKTTQRVLIEELPDAQNTKTDTSGIEAESTRVPHEDTRLFTEDSRESNDSSQYSSDSGISIDTIQKLAEQVGSTIIEREPCNIEQKVKQYKERNLVDLEDIDD